MARVAIQWKRQNDGDWKPIGVWFGTHKALQSRVLPGQRMDAWFSTIHQLASPPLIENGTMPGTWEDFIDYALDALSNGHDLMVSEVPAELTLDRTYAKWVLGLEGSALDKYSPATIPNVSTIPASELEGAGKGMAPIRRFAEGSSADDHPYGPWTGGSKGSGGRPGGAGGGGGREVGVSHDVMDEDVTFQNVLKVEVAMGVHDGDFDPELVTGVTERLRTSRTVPDGQVEAWDRLVRQGGVTTGPSVVHRGVGATGAKGLAGTMMTDRGYPFATSDLTNAKRFQKGGGGIVAMHLPAGTPMVLMSQNDYLLPRDLTWHVAKADGGWDLTLRTRFTINGYPLKDDFSEASDDDHPYGAWTGGAKSAGGHAGGGGAEDALKRVEGQSVEDATLVGGDGYAQSEADILTGEGARLGTAPNSGNVVDITSAMNREGRLASVDRSKRRIAALDALGPSARVDPADRASVFDRFVRPGRPNVPDVHKAGDKVVVYRGPDGKTAGFIALSTHEGKTGITMVHVDPSQRGKGIASKMYDYAQDNGVNLYGIVGQAGEFTPSGKAFTTKWLEHRVVLEAAS